MSNLIIALVIALGLAIFYGVKQKRKLSKEKKNHESYQEISSFFLKAFTEKEAGSGYNTHSAFSLINEPFFHLSEWEAYLYKFFSDRLYKGDCRNWMNSLGIVLYMLSKEETSISKREFITNMLVEITQEMARRNPEKIITACQHGINHYAISSPGGGDRRAVEFLVKNAEAIMGTQVLKEGLKKPNPRDLDADETILYQAELIKMNAQL